MLSTNADLAPAPILSAKNWPEQDCHIGVNHVAGVPLFRSAANGSRSLLSKILQPVMLVAVKKDVKDELKCHPLLGATWVVVNDGGISPTGPVPT